MYLREVNFNLIEGKEWGISTLPPVFSKNMEFQEEAFMTAVHSWNTDVYIRVPEEVFDEVVENPVYECVAPISFELLSILDIIIPLREKLAERHTNIYLMCCDKNENVNIFNTKKIRRDELSLFNDVA